MAFLINPYVHYVFYLLALLPGLIALIGFLISVPKRVKVLREEHARYSASERNSSYELKHQQDAGAERTSQPTTDVSSSDNGKNGDVLDNLKPQLAGVIVGVIAITALFMLAAAMSDKENGIGVPIASIISTPPGDTEHPSATPTDDRTDTPTPTVTSTPSPRPTTTSTVDPASAVTSTVTQTPTPAPTGTNPINNLVEGRRALVIAAYGSYITTTYFLITRLNSSGVTGTFLVNCALRTAIAFVLAFIAGEFGVFASIASSGQAAILYLLLGMFPVWAIDFVRRKGLTIFQISEEGCENLPLCLVDGLDDGIIDRLAESGMWDIQHLAVAEPKAVSARTLYPLERIVDWIDQALLIVYVKSAIVHYRALGIRAATNLATLYGQSEGLVFSLANAVKQGQEADVLIKNLATKTDVPLETVKIIGRELFFDYKVNVIWRFSRQQAISPLNLQLFVEAIFEAARQAAQQAKITFDSGPALGEPIKPTLSSAAGFKDPFVTALNQKLGELGYRWAGSFTDIANLGNWSDVVDRILTYTIFT